MRFLLKKVVKQKFSSDFIDDLKDKIKTSEKGFKIKIDDNKLIVSEYGLLYCCKKMILSMY